MVANGAMLLICIPLCFTENIYISLYFPQNIFQKRKSHDILQLKHNNQSVKQQETRTRERARLIQSGD